MSFMLVGKVTAFLNIICLGTSPLEAGAGRSQLSIRSALLRRSASLAVGPATTPGAQRWISSERA